MDDKCLICHRPSVDRLDPATARGPRKGLPVCRDHRTLLMEALREAASLPRSERLLGFGVPIYASDEHGNEVPLSCDRAKTSDEAHTWSGQPGAMCAFCLALYVDVLIEERNRILADPEIDPDDVDYGREIVRRAERLLNAVTRGLVDRYEAKALVERWSAHV